MAELFTGRKKLGQPEPLSYFVSEEKSGVPQQRQTYTPSCLVFQYFPVNAGSVPFSRVMRNSSGDNSLCLSRSDLLSFPMITYLFLLLFKIGYSNHYVIHFKNSSLYSTLYKRHIMPKKAKRKQI